MKKIYSDLFTNMVPKNNFSRLNQMDMIWNIEILTDINYVMKIQYISWLALKWITLISERIKKILKRHISYMLLVACRSWTKESVVVLTNTCMQIFSRDGSGYFSRHTSHRLVNVVIRIVFKLVTPFLFGRFEGTLFLFRCFFKNVHLNYMFSCCSENVNCFLLKSPISR